MNNFEKIKTMTLDEMTERIKTLLSELDLIKEHQ